MCDDDLKGIKTEERLAFNLIGSGPMLNNQVLCWKITSKAGQVDAKYV